MFTKDENGNTVYRHDGFRQSYMYVVEYQCQITAFGFPTVRESETMSFDFNPVENINKVVEMLEKRFGVIKGTVKILSFKKKLIQFFNQAIFHLIKTLKT